MNSRTGNLPWVRLTGTSSLEAHYNVDDEHKHACAGQSELEIARVVMAHDSPAAVALEIAWRRPVAMWPRSADLFA